MEAEISREILRLGIYDPYKRGKNQWRKKTGSDDMLEIKTIKTDKAKVIVTLEDESQLIGYVLKMDVRNNRMDFLKDGSIDPIQFPLNNVIQVEEIPESLQ